MIKIANCLRPSRYGDLIVSLPFLNWLEGQYPNSHKMVLVDKSCAQIAPLLINHPLIDKIYISKETDKITQDEENWFKKFDLVMEPYAPILKEGWFNDIGIIESIFKMSWLRGAGRIKPEEWNTLTEDEKKPRLIKWFPTEKQGSFISIWGSAGYENADPANKKRNPSKEYWHGLINRLIKDGYEVVQLGLPSPSLHPDILNYSHYSLFDAIKLVLGSCICSIGTDSGSMWALGAYGVNQLLLTTYWREGHYQNPNALVPINYKNRAINLFNPDINSIEYDKIIEGIKLLNE